ncbi:MAG: SH3 domain-containing protein [Oscillospiraceae bacterium]|nr:SH3 domain-containing protein [Oscillospiraceae bacterium]
MRKLFSKSVFLALLAAALLSVTAFAAAPAEGFGIADALRLRTGPSTEATTITYLNSGDLVQILGSSDNWYQVSCREYVGYVFASYVVTRDNLEVSEAPSGESLAGRTGTVTGNEVSLYAGPSGDDEVLSDLSAGAQVTVLSVSGQWCLADNAGQQGYIDAAYVSVDGLPLVDPQGVVTGSCVNVRSVPSTDGSILTKVYAGEKVELLSLENDWYAVSVDGTRGYIRSDYIRIYAPGSASGVGAEVAAAAYDYLGVRYSYGGASPKGFDCSGFTMYMYSLYGYSLPHSATAQWNTVGTYVDRADLQPGDLVLFCDPSQSNGKACSHVGIYVGDNQFIHATSSSTGYVRLNDLSEAYYNNYYVGAKRVA